MPNASLMVESVFTDALSEQLQIFREFGTQTRLVQTQGQLINGERVSVPTYINEFWTARQRQANLLHEVSYRTCFKPQLPRFFIERLTQPGEVVPRSVHPGHPSRIAEISEYWRNKAAAPALHPHTLHGSIAGDEMIERDDQQADVTLCQLIAKGVMAANGVFVVAACVQRGGRSSENEHRVCGTSIQHGFTFQNRTPVRSAIGESSWDGNCG